MPEIKPPAPPVVGGIPKLSHGKRNKPINWVTIHSAVIPCEPGRARQLGAWNRDGTTGGSWHYAVDPKETIQCSWDSYDCFHAPPSKGSIGIEMADWPEPIKAGVKNVWQSTRWVGQNHRDMLERTAELTAHLCLAYDVPVRMVGISARKAGKRGIVTHNTVSKAFGQSSHWDPGMWPRAVFMRRVRKHVALMTGVEEKTVKAVETQLTRDAKGKPPKNLLMRSRANLEKVIARGTWEQREARIRKALEILPSDGPAS